MPVVDNGVPSLFRGRGVFIGLAQGRGLVKVNLLQQLVVVDDDSCVDGVRLARFSKLETLRAMVDAEVEVVCEFRDGGWCCNEMTTIRQGDRTGVLEYEEGEKPTQRMKLEYEKPKAPGLLQMNVTKPKIDPMLPLPHTPPPGFGNADLPDWVIQGAQKQRQAESGMTMRPSAGDGNAAGLNAGRPPVATEREVVRDVGVVVESKHTHGHIRSLKHGRIFYHISALRPVKDEYQLNLIAGALVAYEAEMLPRPDYLPPPARGWRATKVAYLPAPGADDEERNYIVGYGAVSEIQQFYGYIRSSETQHKIFFPRSNMMQQCGHSLPVGADAQPVLGMKVKFVAFFVGMNRMNDLRTPYVALFVRLQQIVNIRPKVIPSYHRYRRPTAMSIARSRSTTSVDRYRSVTTSTSNRFRMDNSRDNFGRARSTLNLGPAGRSRATGFPDRYQAENSENMRRARSMSNISTRLPLSVSNGGRYEPNGRSWTAPRNIYRTSPVQQRFRAPSRATSMADLQRERQGRILSTPSRARSFSDLAKEAFAEFDGPKKAPVPPATTDEFQEFVAELRAQRRPRSASVGPRCASSVNLRSDSPDPEEMRPLTRSRSTDRVVRFETMDNIDRLYSRDRELRRAQSSERCPATGVLPSCLKPRQIVVAPKVESDKEKFHIPVSRSGAVVVRDARNELLNSFGFDDTSLSGSDSPSGPGPAVGTLIDFRDF